MDIPRGLGVRSIDKVPSPLCATVPYRPPDLTLGKAILAYRALGDSTARAAKQQSVCEHTTKLIVDMVSVHQSRNAHQPAHDTMIGRWTFATLNRCHVDRLRLRPTLALEECI
jgi:hypothetical protein